MKYLWTTITVSSLDRAVDFYTGITGLKMERRFPAGAGEIAFLTSTDTETKVELIEKKDFCREKEKTGVSLGFAAEDLFTLREDLEKKGFRPTEIIRPNPDTAFFFIEDPDGLQIQFSGK